MQCPGVLMTMITTMTMTMTRGSYGQSLLRKKLSDSNAKRKEINHHQLSVAILGLSLDKYIWSIAALAALAAWQHGSMAALKGLKGLKGHRAPAGSREKIKLKTLGLTSIPE